MSRKTVVDTNVLVSSLILPFSKSSQALEKAIRSSTLLISEETIEELNDVLSRPKFEKYFSLSERQEFVEMVLRTAELIPILYQIQACRDPKDDKFLSLAVNGESSMILTGDQDLLVLDPFRNIRILTPATYLEVL